MQLVITEKPSVAAAIGDVLGASIRHDGYYEGGGYIVSWCIGHLLGLADPQSYDEKYAKWRLGDLPIAINDWKHTPTGSASAKKQLQVLKKLLGRKDVDTVVNAADAGREGELIFREVYEYFGCKKPIKRLWISSLEEESIKNGVANLLPGADYNNLYEAALCRGKADWLVGINLTRLFTKLYNSEGVLSVGRVQTPTLSMIVAREHQIQGFTKEPFFTIEITKDDFTAEREKLKDKDAAEEIRKACDGQTATIVSIEKQEKSTSAPKLYDLTTLQREANRMFGYPASKTLESAQKLYEQKILTYPRTDSKFLSQDMAAGVEALVPAVADAMPFDLPVDMDLSISQVINSAKVTDHHAIIPTQMIGNISIDSLPGTERNILLMVCTRLLAAIAPKHTYAETVITAECSGEMFKAKGKTVLQEGWKAIDPSFAVSCGKKTATEEKVLPVLEEGQELVVSASLREGFTQPPKPYTEDLLLSAMENAGKEDMPDDAERKGIGTPATRADIIEGLLKKGYITRESKQLKPTEKGINTIKVLPESVKAPMLTAEWEHSLKRIERGEVTAHEFMNDINNYVRDIVESNQAVPDEHKDLFPSNRPARQVLGKCPRCDNGVVETIKAFSCANRDCKFALWKDNKFFTAKKKSLTLEIATALINDGRIFVAGLYSEKADRTYDATILLDSAGEGYPSFKMEFEK